MNLTEHFTLAELIASDYAERHGINNMPTDEEVLRNLHELAAGMELVRRALDDRPIFVNSAYRGPKLNSAIGGSKTSAHMRGLACDFRVAGMTPREVCLTLAPIAELIGFDQLIYEHTWTHIGFPDGEDKPRRQVLTAVFKAGEPTRYVPGIA